MNLKVLFDYAQVQTRICRVLNTLRSSYGEAHAFYDETHGPYGQAHGSQLPFAHRKPLKPYVLVGYWQPSSTVPYGMVYGLDNYNQRQQTQGDADPVWVVWRVLANKTNDSARA